MKIYFEVMIFWFGIICGSFFNVCIFRIPNNKSISYPASHCYKCNTRLKPLDLIPILSWIFLKGKCRYCCSKISLRYPLIELLTGITFLLVYEVYGMNFITIDYLILVALLIIITFIDIDYYIIPDKLIIIGSLFALIFNIFIKGIFIWNNLIGGLVCGGGMLLVISLIEKIVKQEVMGGGDIKLFFMIGLFIGIKLGVVTILLSIYLGATYGVISILYNKIKNKNYNSMIPYGPFISIAAFIAVIYGADIINWYIKLII